MTTERYYILGTQEEKLERLGLQHRVWRAVTLDRWRRNHCLTTRNQTRRRMT
jgi:hypothetical protein